MSAICNAIKYLCTVMIPQIKTIEESIALLQPLLAQVTTLQAQVAALTTQVNSLQTVQGNYAQLNSPNIFTGTQTFQGIVTHNGTVINNGITNYDGPVTFNDPVDFTDVVTFATPPVSLVLPDPIDIGGQITFIHPPIVPGLSVNGSDALDENPPPSIPVFSSGTPTDPEIVTKITDILNGLHQQGIFTG